MRRLLVVFLVPVCVLSSLVLLMTFFNADPASASPTEGIEAVQEIHKVGMATASERSSSAESDAAKDIPSVSREAKDVFSVNTESKFDPSSPDATLEIQVNYAHDWVAGVTDPQDPGVTVVVTVTDSADVLKADAEVTAEPSGDFFVGCNDWWAGECPDIVPGDIVKVYAEGLLKEINPVGSISGRLDEVENTVEGDLNANWFADPLNVRCAVWEDPGSAPIDMLVDPDGGTYHCDFDDVTYNLARGQMVAVSYYEPDGDQVINIIEWPWVQVNYGQDWVGASYYLGHTFWMTVTNDVGSVKATATADTQPNGGWGGDGFQTQEWQWWPEQPDIVPGDFVYYRADDGYTNVVEVGDIGATLDVSADTVDGTILAPFGVSLTVECHPWGAWEAGMGWVSPKQDLVFPDGSDPFLCDWGSGGEWDMLPGQEIGVIYSEPDGDNVVNVVSEPAAYLRIEKTSDGQPAEGGNFLYHIRYSNDGDAPAENVEIIDTIFGGVYLADTSGLPRSGSGSGPIIWDIGTLNPGEGGGFDLFVEVTASAGETISNTAELVTSSYTQGEDWERWGYAENEVLPNDTHLNIGKWAWTDDPAPGNEFVYGVGVCNNGSTGSTEVTLEDNLQQPYQILQDWWSQHPGWYELYRDPVQLIVTNPSIPSHTCSEVYLSVMLDPGTNPGDYLSNLAIISAANDLETDDNEAFWESNANEPHINLHTEKSWHWGRLYPGGELTYGINYFNYGNVPVGPILITDTFPVSTTFVSAWHNDIFGGHEFPPTILTNDYAVWELPGLDNGTGGDIELTLAVDSGAVPGIPLENWAEITRLPDEDSHEDNEDVWVEELNPAGPNLRVQKFYNWDGEGWLNYQIHFENIGSETISDVWVNDELLDGQEWGGWWDMGFNWEQWITFTHSSTSLNWNFSDLYPGDSGWLYFNATVPEPGVPLRWYTNTVQITIPPLDVNPSDNWYGTSAFSGPELRRVELWVNPFADSSMWGEAAPGLVVTVTNPFGTQFNTWADPNCGGCWNIDNLGPLSPGDNVVVEAGAGLQPVVVTIPNLDINVDTAADEVFGQVGGWFERPVEVHGNWPDGFREVPTDGAGNFLATYTDIPGGSNGYIRFIDMINYAEVIFHQPFYAQDLILDINYGHDWIEGPFEPGHTIWITVTESDGATVKGTAELTTDYPPDWEHPGFATWWQGWLGDQPNLDPYDWVFAKVDTGSTSASQIGEIDFTVDYDADLVTGNLFAPVPDPLVYLECQTWSPAGGPPIDDMVDPAGGTIYCDYSAIPYDIVPGNTVAVRYWESDGDSIVNTFDWPHLTVSIGPWSGGNRQVWGDNAPPNSVVDIVVTDEFGGFVAETIVPTDEWGNFDTGEDLPEGSLDFWSIVEADFGNGITDTVTVFPMGGEANPDTDVITITAAGDPSFIVELEACNHNEGWCDWFDLGPIGASGVIEVDMMANFGFDVRWGQAFYAHMSVWNNHTVRYAWALEAPELGVWKWHVGNYARPGGVMVYNIQYRNDGNGPAENVAIVDTLPAGLTYANDAGGFPVTIGPGNLVTWDLGTLQPGDDKYFMVTLNVDPGVLTGTQVLDQNCVEIFSPTPGDENLDNNWNCTGPVDVWEDEVEIGIDKWINPGDPTPGQEFEYEVQWCNNRGAAAGPAVLTDTLPPGATLQYWYPQNWNERFWQEVSISPDELVLYAPGLPGDYCESIYLRLFLEPWVEISTTLENFVVLDVADDVYPDNNWRLHNWGHASPPRLDLQMNKSFNEGILVPGGYVDFSIDYANNGNIATTVHISDDLPPGLSYVGGWWSDSVPWQDQPFPDPVIIGNQLTWDLPEVPVSHWHGFNIRLGIDTPDPILGLQNCATITGDGADDTPGDNSDCATFDVIPPGPNLKVDKLHNWNGDGQLRYSINYYNLGDQTVNDFWIVDTLPDGTHWNGWWDMDGGWWERLIDDIVISGNQLMWHFSEIHPGERGWIDFQVNLDDPGAPLVWYTNIVDITVPPGETTPDDNYHEDVAFSGGEVEWVELNVYGTHIWGYAPRGPIVITTPYEEDVLPWEGDFDWELNHQLLPGDVITVTASAGLAPVTIIIPDPFDAEASSLTDHVWGQVDHLDAAWLDVDLNDGPSIPVQTDTNGFFDVLFPDIPRGGEGEVRYSTQVDYTDVVFHRYWRSPDLILNINYAHDWIDGYYEAGHTAWITVTESDGSTVKGTAELYSNQYPWGFEGFSTDIDGWLGEPPDILPGDWVFGKVDNGYTSEVQVFTIGGAIDIDADSIVGALDAPWYVGVVDFLDVECQPQGAWDEGWEVDSKYSFASPNGAVPYLCQWDPATEWDIDYYKMIAVWATDPDGDHIVNIFEGEAIDVGVWKWHMGNYARPGGVVVYGIYYQNDGNIPAENVQITDTLPANTTYFDDTGGFPVGIGPGNLITWTLGALQPYESGYFYVTLNVAPDTPTGEGVLEPNCLAISTTTTPDSNPGNENWCSEFPVDLWSDDVEIGVDKWAEPGDPHPGQLFRYKIQWCNNRGAAAGPVVLTDTLPAGVTLLEWREEQDWQNLWNEVSFDGSELVLYAPGLPGDRCEQIELLMTLDSEVPIGTLLLNTAELNVDGDVDPENNWVMDENTQVGPPRYDLDINKRFHNGVLVPGGQFNYFIDFRNNGNIATSVTITETIPPGFIFDGAWWGGDQPNQDEPLPDPTIIGDLLIWELGELPIDHSRWFHVAFTIDPDAIPGAEFGNCVEITGDGPDDRPNDNASCETVVVNSPGPNLRVFKEHGWNGEGQLEYVIHFLNIGDEPLGSYWLTDTLPLQTHWNGWWDMDYDWSRLFDDIVDSGSQLTWRFSEINPGDMGRISLQVDLEEPGAPARWYTNTVEITIPEGETDPGDNYYNDVAFSGGELRRVEFWFDGYGHSSMWGEAVPGTNITITTEHDQFYAWSDPDCGGCWEVEDTGLIDPGDVVEIVAGDGIMPVTVTIPDPLTAAVDSGTDRVHGQIGGWDSRPVEIHGEWAGGYQEVTSEADGSYEASFVNIPPGADGYIRFSDEIDFAEVIFHQEFHTLDLLLEVNYGHDWIEGYYEPGHTIWITVTESDGNTVKGLAELWSDEVPFWEGETGFSTNWHGWLAGQPDILPGDWIFGRVDNGYTATLKVFNIAGVVDVDNDLVSGTVDAPWYIEQVDSMEVECHPWGAWEIGLGDVEVKYSSASPGRLVPFYCGWNPDTEWNIDYFQEIGIWVHDPNGHRIINALAGEAIDLSINKWVMNDYTRPGGVAVYGFYYQNNGNLPAENVQIVDILPEHTSYAGDTSGFPVQIGAGNVITWSLGTVDPGEPAVFRMTVDVAIDAPGIDPNHTFITSTTTAEVNVGDEEAWSESMGVQEDEIDIGVDKGVWPEDPHPGEIFFYTIHWCNNRSTAAGPVVMTDTLPAEATLLEWYERDWWLNYWTEISFEGQELVLYANGLPGNQCHEIELVMQLDPETPIGTTLVNEATISTEGDNFAGNNHVINEGAVASPPRYELGIDKVLDHGIFSPGGWGLYHIYYWNEGNISTTVVISEVVPPGMSFAGAWWNDLDGEHPLPEPALFGNLLIWELGSLPVGGGRSIGIRFDIDLGALPGTEFGNCVTIRGEGPDSWPENNESCETMTLNPEGPNLRVVKSHRWPNEEQISYDITFMNIGTDPFTDVLITDTLPISTTAASEPWSDYWSNIHIIDNTANGQWGFVVEDLPPGEAGQITFDVNLDDPGQIPAWYTNTVEISVPDGDVNPDDNIYYDLAGKIFDTYLRVSPPEAQLSVGDTITVEVVVENVTNLQAIVLEMIFDPSLLEVVDADLGAPGIQIDPGDCPTADFVTQNSADNVTGVINYDVTSISGTCEGNGVVMTIVFEALAGGTSPVQFNNWTPVDPDGFDIPVIIENGSIEISSLGLLQGQVELQGRRNHSGAEVCAVEPTSGESCLTTTTNGQFSFWLDTAVYTVTVEMVPYLNAEKSSVFVAAGSTTTLSQVKLLGGDVDNNGSVNILDLAILGGRYLSVCGDPAYDNRADINNDCAIDIRDLAIAGGNYLKSSPVYWP